MPKNRIIITLGLVVALLPVLGFPRSWEAVFQVVAGLSIALISVWVYVDKRLSQKAKARVRQARRYTDVVEPAESSSNEESVDHNQLA